MSQGRYRLPWLGYRSISHSHQHHNTMDWESNQLTMPNHHRQGCQATPFSQRRWFHQLLNMLSPTPSHHRSILGRQSTQFSRQATQFSRPEFQFSRHRWCHQLLNMLSPTPSHHRSLLARQSTQVGRQAFQCSRQATQFIRQSTQVSRQAFQCSRQCTQLSRQSFHRWCHLFLNMLSPMPDHHLSIIAHQIHQLIHGRFHNAHHIPRGASNSSSHRNCQGRCCVDCSPFNLLKLKQWRI